MMLPPLRPTAPSIGLKPVLQPVRYDAPPEPPEPPEPPGFELSDDCELPVSAGTIALLCPNTGVCIAKPRCCSCGGGGGGGLRCGLSFLFGFCHVTMPVARFDQYGRFEAESRCMVHS